MSEFDLISEISQRIAKRGDVLLGIGDDCAIVQPTAGKTLAISTDTSVSGVHFFPETEPYLIGYKALAVNLSDLAAMGAKPLWYTLNLTLPSADLTFASELTRGMHTLAVEHGIGLIGGDTTAGPLALSITVIGELDPGCGLKRSGAQIGDGVYVSGTLGDAAGALHLRQQKLVEPMWLTLRMDQPTPRVALGRALLAIANSAIDVSDGLLADLGHICKQSQCCARVFAERLPLSQELVTAYGPTLATHYALSGGDDYELCFSANPDFEPQLEKIAAALALRITRIGTIVHALEGDVQHDTNVQVLSAQGKILALSRLGYQHFVSKQADRFN
jgi:thiamine-monophosphate kinase